MSMPAATAAAEAHAAFISKLGSLGQRSAHRTCDEEGRIFATEFTSLMQRETAYPFLAGMACGQMLERRAATQRGSPRPGCLRTRSGIGDRTAQIAFYDLPSLRFTHAHTDIFSRENNVEALALGDALVCGSTTWVADVPATCAEHLDTSGLHAWLQWEWLQIAAGVIAIVNPLDLRSNIALVGPDGHRMSRMNALIRFNRFIHRLDWQSAVLQTGNGGAPKSRSDTETQD